MEIKDIVALTILFLVSFYLYKIPLGESKFPFGEGDAVHKYGLADWMYSVDKAPSEMPFFYAVWYPYLYKDDFFRPANPLPYFIDIVSARIIGGGDRFTAPNIFLALTASSVASFSVYFLMRKLYSFWAAFLSGFILLFPLQSVMAYLWGQRPHLIALAYIPLILYCYYKYTDSVLEKKPKLLYLVLTALLMSGLVKQLQMATVALAVIAVYTVVLLIRERKLPFRISHALVSLAIAVVVLAPFLRDVPIESQKQSLKLQYLGHLFYWFKPLPDLPNPSLYQYNQVHGGWWTLPFLVLGVLLLLFRRKKEDLVMLSWLAALYLVLHLYVINFVEQGRAARPIYGTAHIFYPIIVIGFLGLLSFIKMGHRQRSIARYVLVIVFIALAIVFNARPAFSTIKQAYPPALRMTPYQYEAAQWLEQNLPANALIYSSGSLTLPKMRWMHMFSHRASLGYNQEFEDAEKLAESFPVTNHITHILLDYSDYALLGNSPELEGMKNQLQEFERQYTTNATLLYDKDFIKVYEIAKP
jgi:hypothetical protein